MLQLNRRYLNARDSFGHEDQDHGQYYPGN
jgi:hypothetical protein